MAITNDYMDSLLDDEVNEDVDVSYTPIRFFHVDKREFKVDDVILPNGEPYEKSLSDERLEIEDLLNKCSFLSERRSNHVFLFDEYSNALRYAGKVKGNIYEVTIDLVDLCHKADMNKLDNALDVFRYTDSRDIRVAVVQEYWKNGTHTFSPCYEYLVTKCKVVKQVINIAEVMDFHRKHKHIIRSIEQCFEYRKTINEIYSV